MKKNLGTLLFSTAGMFLLIIDSQTAASGARDGIELCIHALIPSLFPFFLVSNLLTSAMLGDDYEILRPLGKLYSVSPGSESLLAVGFLGGYPVGAQNVALSFRSGQISGANARRMMAFCNNAGPSFLFGIIRSMFAPQWVVWILWFIQIAGATLVSLLIPSCEEHVPKTCRSVPISFSRLMEQSLKTMAYVCGWVVLFRIILQFLNKWILGYVSVPVRVLLSGLLELSNGCMMLSSIENEGLRFLMCSIMLAMGGLCVTMQTFSVCRGPDMSLYFPGKILQSIFCFLVSYFAQQIIFPDDCIHLSPAAIGCPIILFFLMALHLRKNKNISSNSSPLVV